MTYAFYSRQARLIIVLVGVLVLGGGEGPVAAHCQVRAGAAYLKIQPSVRYQGMAGTMSAAVDEVQAFYANPAATAFAREWQWSAAYVHWIADIYGLAANYGRQLRTPWSRRFNVNLGLTYQGVREFDSTQGRKPPVAANDVMVALSLGSLLGGISPHIALGGNVKYLRSDLMGNVAGSFMFDMGVIYCSPRFALGGPFGYGLFSAGLAMDNLGAPLEFAAEKTPLPYTLRGGLALNVGTHRGLQLQIAGDYLHVRDEIGRFCVGAELAWGYRLAVRTGYEFNERLLSKLSVGMSLRLDDRTPLARGITAGTNQALRLDIGGLEANELFQVAGRTGAHHYTIGPEQFDLLEPLPHDTLRGEVAELRWEASRDPDLFDDVRYVLLVERATGIPAEQSHLAQGLSLLQQKSVALADLVKTLHSSLFLFCDSTFGAKGWPGHVSYRVADLPAGDYLWSVIAYDRDEHLRIASQRIWPFHVVQPDLQVVDIIFQPDIWITESDTQGVVSVHIRNNSPLPAKRAALVVFDELDNSGGAVAHADTAWQGELLDLRAWDQRSVSFTWRTLRAGLHRFRAVARLMDAEGRELPERDLENNRLSRQFYTIPKGSLALPEVVEAFVLPVIFWQVPLVTKVFFEPLSAEVAPQYYRASEWLYAPLDTIARRVVGRTDVVLKIEGYCDAVNGEQLELAKARALAVRDAFLTLGVSPEQVPLDSVSWAPSPDRKVTQNPGVHQERRNVRIRALRRATGTPETDIIAPVPFRNVPEPPIPLPVFFANTVRGIVPLQFGWLFLRANELGDSLQVGYATSACDSLLWHLRQQDVVWLNRTVTYTLVLTDTLGRRFLTRDRRSLLVPKGCDLPIVVGLAEFNDPQPFPILSWQTILQELGTRLKYSANMYYHFVGHACGITPRSVNNAFSRLRATNLQEDFLKAAEAIADRDPALYRLLMSRLDREGTVGKGADEPFVISLDERAFTSGYENIAPYAYSRLASLLNVEEAQLHPFLFHRKDGKLILEGDNESPVGRQVNRRIQIEFFYK